METCSNNANMCLDPHKQQFAAHRGGQGRVKTKTKEINLSWNLIVKKLAKEIDRRSAADWWRYCGGQRGD